MEDSVDVDDGELSDVVAQDLRRLIAHRTKIADEELRITAVCACLALLALIEEDAPLVRQAIVRVRDSDMATLLSTIERSCGVGGHDA